MIGSLAFTTHGLLLTAVLIAACAHSQTTPEPLGPSSRRTPLTISEIMYKPAARADGRNLEFIELYNSNPWPEDVSNYRFDGQVQFVFPASTTVPAMGFLIVAASPADLQTVFGLSTVFGPYTNSLASSGAVKLYDEQNALLLHVNYDNAMPWPMGASGSGHSIVLSRPSYGEGDPRAWSRSALNGGSPAATEPVLSNALRNVMFSEILAHTDPPDVDFIELYNYSTAPVDLSGCILSDDPALARFVIPTNTTIPARGYIHFTETELGFGLNAAGETIFFKNPDGSQLMDALKFDAQENGIPYGRFPRGASDWQRLSNQTPGSNNAIPLVSPVGFNEIMYHPISSNDDDQYIELFNRTMAPINLGGWKITDGVSFTFPSNQVLAANSYLVVARNAARLMANYPQLNLANTVGNFGGRLSGAGERLLLTKPDVIHSTNNAGIVITNHVDIVVDEVTYGTGGRWGRWSDGGGSSLELVDARADKRRAANWADSDETAKASWATIECTGVLDNGAGAYSPVQVGLLDAGECMVDDVQVLNAGGVNSLGNGGFENGMTSLSFLGSHSRSSLETNSGVGGSVALHVRTADSVAAGPNAVQITLTNTSFALGQTATLRFKARWLRGCPEPLLRFWGCYLEATGRLPVPANLGTPGLPNSRAVANAGPAIYEVTHTPALPKTNEPVVVTARVSDPDVVNTVTVSYRFDPLTTTTNINMNDGGLNGDLIGGDGIYSATLPARPTNAIAFVITARDNPGVTNRFPELVADNAPVRECVVYFGDPNPTNLFGTYHMWLTQTNVTRWKTLPTMSNEDIDGTLVYNNRVIYNMGGRYSGSPWHQNYDGPAGNKACHFVWSMPKDDRLLGATSFNKLHWPGNDIQYDSNTSINNDATLQREQAAYMFLRGIGAPWMYRRFVAVYVNGVRRGKLYEDALRPTGGTVQDQYFPDDTGGQFYKLQRWYEGTSTALISECLLQKYVTTGGAWKPARFRPVWALKETGGSLSDFTNVYALVTAANAYSQSNYTDLLENVVDMENWMRVSAANHAAGDWDCFGSNSGQNADAWVSAQHRWTLYTIDFSICLDNQISGVGLFTFRDPVWSQMINVPKYRRMYCRALQELVNGIMLPEKINPLLDAKYAAFTAGGLGAASPANTKSWIASQRTSIRNTLTPLNATNFSLSTNSFTATSSAVTLTGVAPLNVVTLQINGQTYTPTWLSVSNWSVVVPAPAGTNTWTLTAFDRFGNATSSPSLVTVENASVPESPVGNVVFNEIMFNAPSADGEYVELFNRSANTAFDLAGWTVNGLGYTFPPGSVLQPQQHLVLAKSSVAFAATYSALTPVFGTFDGNLQFDGETLTLNKPGVPPELDLVVDRVRYETNAPWPAAPVLSPGISLQLVDAAQDNSRVANWAAAQFPAALRTPGETNSVGAALPEFPALWLNEVQAQNLTGPMDNFSERDPWIELYNAGTNTISLDGFYLGTNYANPTQWAFPAGASVAPGQFLVVWLDGQSAQTSGAFLHTDFRLAASGSTLALSRYVDSQPQIVDFLNFPALPANYSYGDVPDGQPFYRQNLFQTTPGGTNSAALPPVTVSINEWMAENNGYLFNPATGKFDDWFELYNPAATPANLAGYYLTDSLTNRFQYQIPAGFQIPAGGFLLVWADDKTAANTNGTDLHVPFKLSKDGEAIGLFAPNGTAVDAIVFDAQTVNTSEGRYPDAAGLRLFMPGPSPRAANILPPATRAPSLTGITLQANQGCVLTFDSEPGHTYRVEFKDELNEATWRPIGTNQFATGTTLSFSDNITAPQRFYRVVLVE